MWKTFAEASSSSNDACCFIAVHARCNDARLNRGMNASNYYRIGRHLMTKLLSGVAVFGGKDTFVCSD